SCTIYFYRCSAANVSSNAAVRREWYASTSSSRRVRSSERYSSRRVTERFDDWMFPPSNVPTSITLWQSATCWLLTVAKISSSDTLRSTSSEMSRVTEGYRGKGEYWIALAGPLSSE